MVVLYITMKQKQHITDHSPEPEHICPEDEKFITLARMSRKRQTTTCPDTERNWCQIRDKIQTMPPRRNQWKLCLAALAGAAAMLAGVLAYQHFTADNGLNERIIALAYDDSPQQIVLKDNEQSTDLSGLDSISFLPLPNLPGEKTRKQPGTATETTSTATQKGMQTLSTPRGMDFKVTLSDGSEVWLNAESTLEFPSAFTGKNRQVKLKGEAYFKVARNEQTPFIVCSEEMNIRVLGTEFNFRNYSTPHVSLIRGSVEVFRPGHTEAEARLTPGQSAWCDAQNHIRVKDADTYAVTQWTSGLFYFDHTTLLEILQELGRWYNLGVVFHAPEHAHTIMHFSAMRTDDVNQAIRHLNRLQKGEIKLEGKNLAVY